MPTPLEEAQILVDALTPEEKAQITDGYHTFQELYESRKVLNAAMFNQLASDDRKKVQKSMRHSDGELCFGGGWFIVIAMIPSGQISFHYPIADWDLFHEVEAYHVPTIQYDEHTTEMVLLRLRQALEAKKI